MARARFAKVEKVRGCARMISLDLERGHACRIALTESMRTRIGTQCRIPSSKI
jgi:hypothetical protein